MSLHADEYFIDGSQLVSITAAINPASNPGFLGVASQTISVTNADNDVASITLIPVISPVRLETQRVFIYDLPPFLQPMSKLVFVPWFLPKLYQY